MDIETVVNRVRAGRESMERAPIADTIEAWELEDIGVVRLKLAEVIGGLLAIDEELVTAARYLAAVHGHAKSADAWFTAATTGSVDAEGMTMTVGAQSMTSIMLRHIAQAREMRAKIAQALHLTNQASTLMVEVGESRQHVRAELETLPASQLGICGEADTYVQRLTGS